MFGNEAQTMRAGACTLEASSAYRDTGPELVQMSLIETTTQEIDFLTEMAGAANGSLYELRQRLFGPWPQSASNSKAEASAPSQEARLRDALSRLRSVIADLRENASTLGSTV